MPRKCKPKPRLKAKAKVRPKAKAIPKAKTITFQELKKKFKSKKAFDEWFEINKNLINPNHTFMLGDEDKKGFQKAQKEVDTLLDNYKPYDLSEIEKIYKKAIDTCKDIENREIILKHFNLVLEEIDLIIKNSKAAHDFLIKEQSHDGNIYDFWNEVDQAENIRTQLELKIKKIQLGEIINSDINENESIKNLKTVETSVSKPSPYKQIMNVEEVADYLGISPSTIYQMTCKKKIPCQKTGGLNKYDKDEIDEWRKTGNIPERYNSKKFHIKDKHHFNIKKNLDELTSNLFENGYIDDENKMKVAFTSVFNPKKDKIFWKKDIISLMTFIYLADRLDYFDKSSSTKARTHNSSTPEKEPKEKENNENEVKYSLVLNDFEKMKGGSSSNTTKIWKSINDCICDIRKQIAKREKKDEEDIKEDYTRKETIIYYFEHKEKIKIVNEKIDTSILEIFNKLYTQTLNNKQPSKLLKNKI